jgi:hypothetical protein
VFYTGSAEGMRLTSTGLGIGTSSPAANLHVQSTQASMNLRSTGTGTPYIDFYTSTSSLVGNIYGINGGGVAIGTTGGTERLRVDASGNLGLAVTPNAWNNSVKALQVNNAALASFTSGGNVQTWLANNAYYDNATGWLYKNSSVGAALYAQSFDGSHNWNIAPSGTAGNAITFTQAMTLDASGNLIVGATSNSGNGERAYFDRRNATQNQPVLAWSDGQDNTGYLSIRSATEAGENGAAISADTALFFGRMISGTFTERARIDSSGRLQVGTTSAYESARVTVSSAGSNGVSSTQASSGGYCFLSNAVSNGGTYYFHLFKANGTDTGSITSNGTTTTYATTSDYRLKTVIGAVTGHGARIDALEPIEYTWNSNGLRTRGFLAHKFQEVYADSVTGTKDAIDAEGNPQYQSMQAGSSEVIADLVAEIKALRVRVAQLESN